MTQKIERARRGADIKISVVIPARREIGTIERCIDAILNQTHPAQEIIIVTDPGDPVLRQGKIARYITEGLVTVVEFIRPTGWLLRDTNARRLLGLLTAINEPRISPELVGSNVVPIRQDRVAVDAIALTDAKIKVPADWLEKICGEIAAGEEVVAGVTYRNINMKTGELDNRFFAVMSDAPMSENVRFQATHLDLSNYGKAQGLPVTACLALTTKALQAIKETFPSHGVGGWEDFWLSYEIMKAGLRIRTMNSLYVHRMHKPSVRGFKHFSTGIAAYQFYLRHSTNDFARHRHRQAQAITWLGASWLLILAVALFFFGPVLTLYLGVSMVTGFLGLFGLYIFREIRDWRAFLFPPFILYQIGVWLLGYWLSVIMKGNIPARFSEFLRSLRMFFV
jgi:cellulose synthase/poly-beta-1,6-N-acetylglucosamine synthase-like glycosyltransferase